MSSPLLISDSHPGCCRQPAAPTSTDNDSLADNAKENVTAYTSRSSTFTGRIWLLLRLV